MRPRVKRSVAGNEPRGVPPPPFSSDFTPNPVAAPGKSTHDVRLCAFPTGTKSYNSNYDTITAGVSTKRCVAGVLCELVVCFSACFNAWMLFMEYPVDI